MPEESTKVSELFAVAVRHHQSGNLRHAEQLYRQVLVVNFHPAVLNNLGRVLQDQGQEHKAADFYRRAILLDPLFLDAQHNLATLLSDQKRWNAAAILIRRTIVLRPDFAGAYNALGNTLKNQHHQGQALTCYGRALALLPTYSQAHSNLALVENALGRPLAALRGNRRALALEPSFAEAFNNLGNLLRNQGDLDQGRVCFERALRVNLDFADAMTNLGTVSKDLGRLDEAFNYYRQSLSLKPDAKTHSNLIMSLHYSMGQGAADILDEALRFSRLKPSRPARQFRNPPDRLRRLRIGYVSGDFRAHPVGYFLAGVLEAHNDSAVEVTCYSNSTYSDLLTERLQRASDRWRSIVSLPDAEAGAMIEQDGIDILVDLSGHTGENRLPLFALRPAPVQVSWLGYFGTTGLSDIDYVIADKIVAPPGAEVHFSEKIWRLPGCYLCYSPHRVASSVMPFPALSNGFVTFGCFNNWSKITPETVKTWAEILRRVPGSRLFLKAKSLEDGECRRVAVANFAAYGIAGHRLILEGHSPLEEALAAYNRVDIALDPFPFGGCTTTAETLWMGVPIVTLAGGRWAGLMSLSILDTLGLGEWAAKDIDQYIALACRLASDLPHLVEMRAMLRQRMLNSALCDSVGFAQALETAYRAMWEAWCKQPVDIAAQVSPVRALYADAVRFHQAGKLSDAARLYSQILAVDSGHADSLHLLGVLAYQTGHLGQAADLIRKAIGLNSAVPSYYSNLGLALHDQQSLENAISCYRAALALDPGYAEAHYNLGHALYDRKRLQDAIISYRRSIVVMPDSPAPHNNMGNLLKDLGKIDGAIACYRQALVRAPDFAKAQSNLVMALHYTASSTAADRLREAQRYARQVERIAPVRTFLNSLDPCRRVRIGYVSGDFRSHPVGYFLARVLEEHDHAAFDVTCYSNSTAADGMTARLRNAASRWRSIFGLSDFDAAAMIERDGIDILVDLSGHTGEHRLSMFALKPAPVQVTWLGYFGTTGLSTIDYILADRFVVPPGEEGFFSEQVWRLPASYLCYTPHSLDCPVASLPRLTNGHVTFGCFNNGAKISADTIATWSTILRQVEGARLFLKTGSLAVSLSRAAMLERFAEQGIEADRLMLEGPSPLADALFAYNRVDIALDPFPFGGGTTTAETLWMGVPLIALQGDRWAGRMSQSIMAALDLGEWVAEDIDRYISLACHLAADIPRMAALRATLRQRMENSAFCDGASFTRSLEIAYRGMWRRRCEAGTTPRWGAQARVE